MKVKMIKYWMDGRPFVEMLRNVSKKHLDALDKVGIEYELFEIDV